MRIDGAALQDVPARPVLKPEVSAARQVIELQQALFALGSRTSNRDAKELARSANNVALWLTFLPEDCVAAMITQGWDKSVR
jgi:hypothetical protein